MMEHILDWLKALSPGAVVTGLGGMVSAAGGGFLWLVRLESRVRHLEETSDHTESALTRLEDKIDRLLEHFLPK